MRLNLLLPAFLLATAATTAWALPAAPPEPPVRASAGLSTSALETRVRALGRDHSRPPAEVLSELKQLQPLLSRAAPSLQDAARLIEIDNQIYIGQTSDAEATVAAMQSDKRREGDALALSWADLALLRVLHVKASTAEAVAVSHRLMERREAWRGSSLEIFALQWVATTLSRQGDNTAAAAMILEALDIADRSGAQESKPALLVTLCGINYGIRNFNKGIDYCTQARSLAQALNDKVALMGAAMNLAIIDGEINDSEGQLRELETTLAMAQALKFKRGEAMAHVNLADQAMHQKNWKRTAEQARAGLALALELEDRNIMAVARTNLGEALAQMGDLAGGIKAYEQGLKDVETADELELVVEFLPGMAELYVRAGRLQDALSAMRRRVAEGERLYQRSQSKALAEMQGRFDAAQREKEILLLKRDNDLKSATLETRQLQERVAWLVGAVLVLGGFVLFQAYLKVRRTNRELAVSNSELAFQSNHDPLTGLFNRRSLQIFLQLSEQSARPQDPPAPTMAFVLADIDHFKHVNDTYGHAAGDAVLVEFARRLSGLVRPGDRLFRWGGEEFLILLPHSPSTGLADLCKRILEAVAQEAFEAEGHRIPLTVSLGACPFPLLHDPALSKDWQRHLHFADLALYLSKSRGRNRAHEITAIADASEPTLQALENDLGSAMAQGQVTVEVIQPT